MSFLGSGVGANSFRNNSIAHDQNHDEERCGHLSSGYADVYDADDELVEEDDDFEDQNFYFEPGPTFSPCLGMPSGHTGAPFPPLLAGDIPPLGGPMFSRLPETTGQISRSGWPAQSTSSLWHDNSPAILPWTDQLFYCTSPGPIETTTNSPPRSSQPPPSLPSLSPLSPQGISTLNAWFDLPSRNTTPHHHHHHNNNPPATLHDWFDPPSPGSSFFATDWHTNSPTSPVPSFYFTNDSTPSPSPSPSPSPYHYHYHYHRPSDSASTSTSTHSPPSPTHRRSSTAMTMTMTMTMRNGEVDAGGGAGVGRTRWTRRCSWWGRSWRGWGRGCGGGYGGGGGG